MEIANGIWILKNLFTEEKCREWIGLCEAEGFDEAQQRANEKIRRIVQEMNLA